MNKQTEDKIQALEMWLYRRMLRVSYKDHITNEEILRRVGEKRGLLNMVKKRKMEYFGHLVRSEGFQRLLLDGKIEGTRRRGAQRRTWVRDIVDWADMNYCECVRLAYDRKKWRLLVADLFSGDGT